jgi:hypothetical protein
MNEDEQEEEEEDTSAPTTSKNNITPSPKRAKRQAATVAKDAIEASNQPTSTSGKNKRKKRLL